MHFDIRRKVSKFLGFFGAAQQKVRVGFGVVSYLVAALRHGLSGLQEKHRNDMVLCYMAATLCTNIVYNNSTITPPYDASVSVLNERLALAEVDPCQAQALHTPY